jgi:peptidyl-prolyl cis-trans isomerase D
MATLEKIRNKAALLVIVVGVALFAFIIGDFLRSGSTFFHQRKENIAVVNGENIHYQKYQARVEERINALKSGNRTFTDDEHNQIRQAVLGEMIDEILFSEETEKLGLVVSKDELRDLIMGNNISPVLLQIPAFKNPQTGSFDKAALLHFLQTIEGDESDASEEVSSQLAEMKKSWLTVEQEILKEQLKKKFTTLVSSAILINKLDAKAAYEASKTNVDFDYVAQSYNTIPDSTVNISDAEIQKLYQERKNLYKQEEARLIDYISVNILPDSKDYQVVENKLNNLKENLKTDKVAEIIQNNTDEPYVDAYVSYKNLDENLKNFVTSNQVGTIEGPVLKNRTYSLYKLEGEKTAPDSVKLNVLMMPVTFDQTSLTSLTDSLIKVIKSGVSFADMAKNLSEGKTTGEMGWVTEVQLATQIDAVFKDAVFEAKLNEPILVSSNKGSFLIQVTEKTQPVKKYKIANIQIHVTASQETKSQIYNKLSHFISNNHSLSALKENAAAEGYLIQADVEILKNQINIGNIQNTRQVIQWAFNNKKGSISDIYECQNAEYFVVAAVEGSLAEGYRPVASVSNILKRELINRKKGEKLVAELQSKKLTTMEQYAEAMNTTIQSVKFVTLETMNIQGIGVEPVLNAKASIVPVNEISEPYAGKSKVYVIFVTNKQEGEPYNEEQQVKQLEMQNTYRTYQLLQSQNILKENAKIENNFSRFY